jgi:uncharacterized protein (DUF2252 family)
VSYVDTLAVQAHPARPLPGVRLAFRVLGTGSVGLRSYVALLHGNENDHC